MRDGPKATLRPRDRVAVVAARVAAQVDDDAVESKVAVGIAPPRGEQRLVVAVADQPAYVENEDAVNDLLLHGRPGRVGTPVALDGAPKR